MALLKKSLTTTSALLLAMGGIGIGTPAQAALLGPSPYLSFNDSPFRRGTFFSYFYLENFEDGALNTPGVTSNSISVLNPAPLTDSVDADDRLIDGSGTDGHSLYSNNNSSITFTFDRLPLGSLPTHVGIVWTDVGFANPTNGFDLVTFEAFDPFSISLGITGPISLGDGVFGGQTAEDRFFGAINESGISKIIISMSNSTDWEVDHLQYGSVGVPEPLTILGGGTALAFGVGFKRKLAQIRKK